MSSFIGERKKKIIQTIFISFISMTLLLQISCSQASAAVITINPDVSIGTFQNAVNDAGEGGTVILNPGIYWSTK